MAEWVAISEILRNAALTVAAIVGAILAWRQLSARASNASEVGQDSGRIGEANARYGIVQSSRWAIARSKPRSSSLRQSMFYVRWRRDVSGSFQIRFLRLLSRLYLRKADIDYGRPVSRRSISARKSMNVLPEQTERSVPKPSRHEQGEHPPRHQAVPLSGGPISGGASLAGS